MGPLRVIYIHICCMQRAEDRWGNTCVHVSEIFLPFARDMCWDFMRTRRRGQLALHSYVKTPSGFWTKGAKDHRPGLSSGSVPSTPSRQQGTACVIPRHQGTTWMVSCGHARVRRHGLIHSTLWVELWLCRCRGQRAPELTPGTALLREHHSSRCRSTRRVRCDSSHPHAMNSPRPRDSILAAELLVDCTVSTCSSRLLSASLLTLSASMSASLLILSASLLAMTTHTSRPPPARTVGHSSGEASLLGGGRHCEGRATDIIARGGAVSSDQARRCRQQ